MRPKPFLTYFVLCAIPLLLFAVLNYWNGLRTVDSTVSAIAQNDLNSFNVAVDEELVERKNAILQLAITPAIQTIATKLAESPLPVLHSLPDLSSHFKSVALFDNTRKPLWIRDGKSEWVSFQNWETFSAHNDLFTLLPWC